MRSGDVPSLDRRLQRRSVVDEVVEMMTRKVISGEWPAGSMIPSLRTLAAELTVSTLTLREAIRVMQTRGLLTTKHGVGTSVASQSDTDELVPWMLGAIDVDNYDDLIEARDLIEGLIVRVAADRRTEEQLNSLRDLLAAMRRCRQDPEKFLDVDDEFHIALAESSHNPILLRSILAIRGPLRQLMDQRNRQLLAEHGSLDSSIETHAQIVDAIEHRRGDAGEEVMHEISRRTIEHLGSGS